MKKSISVIAFAICFFVTTKEINAQGTLQFNQVINDNLVPATMSYTVPLNKVFKLESAVPSWNGSLRADGIDVVKNGHGSQAPTLNYPTGSQIWPFPMWFKAGTVLSAETNSWYITGIEFNIVP